MSQCKAIYTLLPVSKLDTSRKFWTSLGFEINENYSDARSVCIEVKKDTCFIFLFAKDYFYEMNEREVDNNDYKKPCNAIQMNSKQEVMDLVEKSISSGAVKTMEPVDHGWLYYDNIIDPDGYLWQILYIDPQVM